MSSNCLPAKIWEHTILGDPVLVHATTDCNSPSGTRTYISAKSRTLSAEPLVCFRNPSEVFFSFFKSYSTVMIQDLSEDLRQLAGAGRSKKVFAS